MALSRGVWGVLATPFTADARDLDLVGFGRQIDLLRSAGCAGVVALGVFGECHALTTAERVRCVEAVVEAALPDLGVVVGIAERSHYTAVEQGRLIARVGQGAIAGLMLQVNTPSVGGLVSHLVGVADAAATGIVVQDHPAASGIRIDPTDLGEAIEQAGVAVAVKAESPPTAPAISLLAPLVEVPVFGGLGGVNLVDELVAGSSGAMTGFSYPEGLVATVDAWFGSGFESARDAWAPWLPLANFESQQGISLALRKEIMVRRGVLRSATVRDSSASLPTSLLDALAAHVRVATGLVA